MVCREAVNRLEAQFDHLGDQSIVTVKFREIAQEAQTSLQEFDIYLTQSNFRQGLVPEGELTGVLLGANSLRGILGRKILEFDEVIAHLRQG
jgi:peroxiredoxin